MQWCKTPNKCSHLTTCDLYVSMYSFHPSTRTTYPPGGSLGKICWRTLCRVYSKETTFWQVSPLKVSVADAVYTVLFRIRAITLNLLSDFRVSANAILCFCCGLRAFKELAYKYRQNIPSSELPGQKILLNNLWQKFKCSFFFTNCTNLIKYSVFSYCNISSRLLLGT